MKVEIFENALLLLLVLSNFLNAIYLRRTKKELDLAEERIAKLKTIEETHDGYISSLSLKVCDANVAIENLRAQFENELSGEIEAVTDKARKEAEAQQSFIDGLRNILDFDGGAFGKGEK